ncbi:glycoside hydrolase family 2 protein [Metabacillus sp. B2-18]|uniref:glycoside hydrolase family 2 protein n=1 Tax=Metabacillus sp. B2-18 TaxID=2897333 RepID=UPI001E3A9983|nr:sugar-binding domain-containing protein [Metabacillus sp. B2-18]UGB33194.1 glycoside hydrolase family 2 [Metabacillus sp. B2-18]
MSRNEYPRPQFVRNNWLNLNGEWNFEFDDENIGLEEKWYLKHSEFTKKINVPFAYQTKRSGINDPSFHDWVWYQQEFDIPESMLHKQILLHFGAVDYRAMVFINGNLVGTHEGGNTPFSFDITNDLVEGKQSIVVRVEDPSEDETIPRGKQYWVEKSAGIWYTRTTGIWQTVWLEAVNKTRIHNVRFTPDIDNGEVIIDFELLGDFVKKQLEIDISFKNESVASELVRVHEGLVRTSINLYNRKILRTGFHHVGWNWSPENPNLFDITVRLKERDTVFDEISSYFGMRKIHTENGMVFLNNRPYYQKLVLDQGYWPEGLLTAPTDLDLKKDIELAKEMGFNGCRKHQKVEDPRFLYWADQLGFLVWGECAASPTFSENAVARLTKEWIEIIDRDYNHPCIVTWVPINESWGVPFIDHNDQEKHHSIAMYHLIHSLDKTRLVISNDGWEMTKTDICAIHNYNHGQKDEKEKYNEFRHSILNTENLLHSKPNGKSIYTQGYKHSGEPILLTEFGGIGFKVGEDNGWGYTSVNNVEDYVADYERVMKAVYESESLHGYCYTQLTDVEQEINGILTYDRKPKCDLKEIRRINEKWHVHVVK